MSYLTVAVDPATVIVAVDPGKAFNRVWVSDGSGLLEQPRSRAGIGALERVLAGHAGVGPVKANAGGIASGRHPSLGGALAQDWHALGTLQAKER